jgi:hypothetical protein
MCNQRFLVETSGQSLLDFWAWSARKGLVPTSIANDLRAASKEVLSVEDNWQTIDIKVLDVDYLMVRFDNLRKFKFKPQSLSAYKSRFKKARKLYLEYLENPSGWHYPGSAKRKASKLPAMSSHRSEHTHQVEYELPVAAPVKMLAPTDPLVQHLEFPIRSGVVARLDLPADLTRDEADRLAAYLQLIVP